jgi:hypothetical protein
MIKINAIVAAAAAAFALTVTATTVAAQDTEPSKNPWLLIGASDRNIYEINSRSVMYGTTKEGMPYISANGRIVNKTTYETNTYGWAMDYNFCQNPNGTVIIADFDDSSTSHHTYVKDGGTVINSIAKALCIAHMVRQEKSLRNNGKIPNG